VQLFAQDRSGVVRIEGTSCAGGDIGTGFLIAPDLVATVAHVVAQADTIALRTDSATHVGHVIGIDETRDVALVRSSVPFTGHVFTLSTAAPQVGIAVGAIGFPEGLPITFTQGSISGLDRSVDIQSLTRTGLVQTDAALNPGNSGGPLLTVPGDVVGLVDAKTDANGISFAVSSGTAKSLFDAWSASPQVQAPPGCASPIGPAADAPAVQSPAPTAEAQAIAATLSAYFRAINRADWHTAWEQFSPSEQRADPESVLAKGDSSSFDFGFKLGSVNLTGGDTAIASVSFTSIQDPAYGPNGESCDEWTLDYSTRNIGGTWLIDSVKGHGGGSTHTAC
jgi:hypothetical protein